MYIVNIHKLSESERIYIAVWIFNGIKTKSAGTFVHEIYIFLSFYCLLINTLKYLPCVITYYVLLLEKNIMHFISRVPSKTCRGFFWHTV